MGTAQPSRDFLICWLISHSLISFRKVRFLAWEIFQQPWGDGIDIQLILLL
eukprot:c39105_g1_i1 orf=100-252(+)